MTGKRCKTRLWDLWNQATAFGTKPSSLLGIYDEWAAYQLDSAVTFLGRWVEAKVSELDEKGRPKHKLKDLLADQEQAVEMNARDAIAMLRGTRGAVRVRKAVRKQDAEG